MRLACSVPYRLILRSALSIGTGVPGPTADDTVVRNARGVPIVPATTLKGAVRSASARLGTTDAILQAAFGRPPTSAGTAIFRDALPSQPSWPIVEEVTRVSLSEARTPIRGRLMTQEVVRPLALTAEGFTPLTFEGEVQILAGEHAEAVTRAVRLGIAGIDHLGSDRSRGHGRIDVALGPVRQESDR